MLYRLRTMSRCGLSYNGVVHEWLIEDAREEDSKVRALRVSFISSGLSAKWSCVGWAGVVVANYVATVYRADRWANYRGSSIFICMTAASVVLCCLTRPDSARKVVEDFPQA